MDSKTTETNNKVEDNNKTIKSSNPKTLTSNSDLIDISTENVEILSALKMLNSEQILCLKDLIYDDKSVKDEDFIKLIEEKIFINEEKICPNCKSLNIIKNGRNSLKRQRYKCKDCGRIFCDFTNSPISYSKKPIESWVQYIKCMCYKLSIRDCAKYVKINIKTSFLWRHKVLNAIKSKLPENLEGIIEIDEVFVNESFKGNHSKDPNFNMGREPIKRGLNHGYENLSKTKVCILCCADRKENILSKGVCRGRATFNAVNNMLNDKIPKGSVLCTNNSISCVSFARTKKLKIYEIFGANEVKNGKYHLQNVKSMGRKLLEFLRNFKGVATKYLNFYIAWFKWTQLVQYYDGINRIINLFLLSILSKEKIKIYDFKDIKAFT